VSDPAIPFLVRSSPIIDIFRHSLYPFPFWIFVSLFFSSCLSWPSYWGSPEEKKRLFTVSHPTSLRFLSNDIHRLPFLPPPPKTSSPARRASPPELFSRWAASRAVAIICASFCTTVPTAAPNPLTFFRRRSCSFIEAIGRLGHAAPSGIR